MHFVTGGAFNGKRKWVLKQYNVDQEWIYISSDVGNPFPLSKKDYDKDILIIENLEQRIRATMEGKELEEVRRFYRSQIDYWYEWEKEGENRHLVIVGSDITKGIVPIDAQERQWRDVVGWIYQDMVKVADQVDVIWYGINQKLK